MAELVIGLIDLCLIGLTALFTHHLFHSRNNHWNKYYPLSQAQYITRNPRLKKGNTVRCYKCGSESLKNCGRYGANSKKRLVSCRCCATRLYHLK